MGIYDRDYYRDEPQGFSVERLLGGRSVVLVLIGLNVGVFVLDALFTPPGSGDVGRASELLSLHNENALQPWYWWRFLTYAFAHANLNHILFNMIGLFFFGRVMEGVLGAQKFFWMYITSILAGSVVWMLGAMSMTGPQALLGASGGVVATVVLFCFFFPQQKVLFMMFIPMPAWVLGIFLVGSDLWGAIVRPEGSSIAFGVHLVGAAYALIYYKTRWDIRRLAPSHWGGAALFKRKPKLRVHQPDVEAEDQLAQQADEVLRKLHQQGEASLSARERRILEDYSRRVKQRR